MKIAKLRKNLTMASSNRSHRSPFAESAYAHAERRELRRQANDMLDDVNIVHAEFQPLAGEFVQSTSTFACNDGQQYLCEVHLCSLHCHISRLPSNNLHLVSQIVARLSTPIIFCRSICCNNHCQHVQN